MRYIMEKCLQYRLTYQQTAPNGILDGYINHVFIINHFYFYPIALHYGGVLVECLKQTNAMGRLCQVLATSCFLQLPKVSESLPEV